MVPGTKASSVPVLLFSLRFREPAVLPKNRHVHFCTIGPRTNARFLHGLCGAGIPRGTAVIGKQYFVRQATILFWIAKATKDPKMSAALMDKAADVKSKVDGP
jgi:hypothetical protein